VFAGLYPVEANQYDALRERWKSSSSTTRRCTTSPKCPQALGFGFRCGFLGLLHMEIVQERLEREYDMDLITTAPTVVYEVLMRDGTVSRSVENPAKLPDPSKNRGNPRADHHHHGLRAAGLSGCGHHAVRTEARRQVNMQYHGRQVMLTYDMPMAEVVFDFFDKLKSVSRGYASLDYEFKEYRAADVVKLDMLVNGDRVDALSVIVHRANAQYRGRELAAKMRELIPRQMYDVAIQAAIGAQHHRPRERQGAAQERAGQVLRRRHHPQEEAAGEAEGRQEAHEAGGQCGNSAGGLPRRAARRFKIERLDPNLELCADPVSAVRGTGIHLGVRPDGHLHEAPRRRTRRSRGGWSTAPASSRSSWWCSSCDRSWSSRSRFPPAR
jgi:GTP-binding protein LepA